MCVTGLFFIGAFGFLQLFHEGSRLWPVAVLISILTGLLYLVLGPKRTRTRLQHPEIEKPFTLLEKSLIALVGTLFLTFLRPGLEALLGFMSSRTKPVPWAEHFIFGLAMSLIWVFFFPWLINGRKKVDQTDENNGHHDQPMDDNKAVIE